MLITMFVQRVAFSLHSVQPCQYFFCHFYSFQLIGLSGLTPLLLQRGPRSSIFKISSGLSLLHSLVQFCRSKTLSCPEARLVNHILCM